MALERKILQLLTAYPARLSGMGALFVRKTIEIRANPEHVWRALTDPSLTKQWVSEFGMANGSLDSEWHAGDKVHWKDHSGKILVGGTVTEVEPAKYMHFTVLDKSIEQLNITEQDGITYKIDALDGRSMLTVEQGDFSAMTDGEKYYEMTTHIWDKVLPKIKALAENKS